MAYTKTDWENLPSTNTPINASALDNIENGIEYNDQRLNGTKPIDNTIYANDFKCKNLFPYTTIQTQSVYVCPCKAGKKYTLSFNGYSSASDKRFFLRTYNGDFSGSLDSYSDNVTISLTGSSASYVASITPSVDGFIYLRTASSYTLYTLTNIQLEEGEQTSYTPYVPTGEEVYSPNEIRIGTWIDGKPLYRRVFETSVLTSTETLILSITNEIVKTVKGWLFNDSGFVQEYGQFYNDSASYTSRTFSDGSYVKTQQNASFINGSNRARVIIEYTKTTD